MVLARFGAAGRLGAGLGVATGLALAAGLAAWLRLETDAAGARPFLLLAGASLLAGLAFAVVEATRLGRRLAAAEADGPPLGRRFQQALLASAHEGMLLLDAGGVCRYAGPASAAVVSHPPEVLVGRRFEELVHPDDRAAVQDCIGTAVAQPGRTHPLAFRFRRADGQWLELQGRFLSALASPEVGGTLVHFRDVSEERRLAAELAAARAEAGTSSNAAARFLAQLGRDLRGPVGSVAGFAHLLQKNGADTRQREQAERIATAADALQHMVADMLDYAGLEAGEVVLTPAPFNLGGLLEALSAQWTPRAEAKGLELFLHLSPDVPALLLGDAARLAQVLGHLLDNAVRCTETGEVVLAVELAGQQADKARLRFSVRDTGVGIPPERLARLFQAGAPSRSDGGFGLGLGIVRRLVALMGSEIEVESRPGLGSSFRFAAAFAVPAERDIRVGRPALGPLRVLVADDSATARDLLTDALARAGLTVHAVGSGAAAIDEVRRAAEAAEAPYDLLLVDWHMPGLDGIAAVSRLRSGGGSAAPAILMAGASEHEEAARLAATAGIEGVLAKPVNPALLLDTLSDILGARRAGAGETALRRHGAEAAAAAPAAGTGLAGRRVLLVEDNAISQQVAQELLEGLGLDVVAAPGGRAGLAALAEADVELVLMDAGMPEMDGFEATRLLRREPSWRELPVIGLLTDTGEAELERARAAGMDGHLAKPLEPQALRAALERWLLQPREAAVPEPAALPGIDIAGALRRVQGNEDLLGRLFQEFGRTMQNVATTMRQALDVGDLRTVERLAATVKNTAASLGMSRVQAAAAQVEAAAHAEHPADIARALDRLDPALEEVIASLAGYREEAPAPSPAPDA